MNRRFYFFLLLAGLFFITACGKDSKTTTVDFKRTDNAVLVRLRVEPDRLNPVLATSNYATQVNSQIFLSLLTADPYSYEITPLLAKARPVVADITDGPYQGGVSYTFEIHDEAVWDNGAPVTAQDYIFTLKAALNPRVQAQRLRPYLAFIKDVRVDASNPKKFTVFTDEKYILGEEAVGAALGVLPEYVYDPQGLMRTIPLTDLTDFEKAETIAASNQALQQFAEAFNSPQFSREKGYVVGCGPYQFEGWETGQRITLSKKNNWWGDKLARKYPALRALPERLEYRPVPEAATALAALKAEELDAMSEIDVKDFIEVRDAAFTKERYNFFTPPALAYVGLYLNNKNPKLNDKRVRRAIAHAIHVDEIIETVYNGFGQRLAVPVNPAADYYDKNLKPIAFDINKAKTLLSEAGWKDTNNDGIVDKEINGERVALSLTCFVAANSETGRNALLLAQGTLRQAGINLEIAAKEFSVIMDDVRKENYEMAAGGRTISPLFWEPKQDWHSESITGGDNHNKFQNAQADKLIDEIRVTLNDKKRDALYKQLQAILYEEQPGVIWFSPTARIAIHKRFDAKPSSITPGYIVSDFDLNL